MDEVSRATWHFPPTGGGQQYGYNNASMEHFKQDAVEKLVRETLQNSLDAQKGQAPVEVIFRIDSISTDIIGADILRKHIEKARKQTEATGQKVGAKAYRKALRRLRCSKPLTALAIIDRNTTGLQGDRWDSLVREEGRPAKDKDNIAGGSFGIGKNAPFNVSELHTIIYSTRFSGPQGRVEKMMGRSQLVSHQCPQGSEMLQHVGFYGIPDYDTPSKQMPLQGPDIPRPFRLDHDGTGLWILGFASDASCWTQAAIKATVDNFFYAIHSRKLVVQIQADAKTKPQIIAHDTLGSLVTRKACSDKTYYYFCAICTKPIGRTRDLQKVPPSLGPLEVYLNQDTGGPRRVAYVNRRGMLITDTRERRRSNPFHPGRGHGGWPDYAAVVMALNDDTDRQIRRMENPAHDLITAHRLPENEQHTMEQELNAVSDQIKELIAQAILDRDQDNISNLEELAKLFPDLDPNHEGNRTLQTRIISPTSTRHDVKPGEEEAATGEEGEEETGPPSHNEDGSGNPENGGGSGNSMERNSTRTGKKPMQSLGIRQVQILRTGPGILCVALEPSREAKETVHFTIEPGGEEYLPGQRIAIEGIQQVEPESVKVERHDNHVISVHHPKLAKANLLLLTLVIQADTPYTGYRFTERTMTSQ